MNKKEMHEITYGKQIRKIIHGVLVQYYNVNYGNVSFKGQEFVACDELEFEDEDGNEFSDKHIIDKMTSSFDMIQDE